MVRNTLAYYRLTQDCSLMAVQEEISTRERVETMYLDRKIACGINSHELIDNG